MPAIPTESMPGAEFIARNLCRPIEVADDARFFAVTETEHLVGGDNWFWLDDNAKVLEFLSRPEIWRRFPQQTLEILRFVRWMCRAPFMFRRVSSPRLERGGGQGEGLKTGTHHIHSLMHVRRDLPHGMVVVGVRFHDNRTADNLLLTGNSVSFAHNGRRYALDIEPAIREVEAVEEGLTLTLRHASELFFKPRFTNRRLGRMTYVYTIDARSMLIGVVATLEVDPSADIGDVELTIGHDRLSHQNDEVDVRYSSIAAELPGAAPVSFAAQQPGATRLAAAGSPYYSIAQAEIAGFALAIHTTPRQPERLAALEVLVTQPGQLHRVRACYRFSGTARGARLEIGEDKLLTAGGFYSRTAEYAELMRAAVAARPSQRAALDYSISYDYGAEINAFAKCYAVCTAEQIVPESQLAPAELRSLFDQYTDVYFDLFVSGHHQGRNTIMSRQLAFVILGVVTMLRTTGAEAYRDKLRRLCDVLLDFEVRFNDVAGQPASGFPYGIGSHRSAFVDGHSASLLALTQAMRYLPDQRIATAIDRGLASFCIETTVVNLGRPVKIDVVSTSIGDSNGNRYNETSYWNFNVGLALRLFVALRNSPDLVLQQIAAKHRERIELLEMVMRWQLQRSITDRGDCIEIRTAVNSGETNSETQPWVMLGLLGHPYD
jgi:hypothetical protein